MKRLTQWLYLVGVGALLAGCFSPDMGDDIEINNEESTPNVALSAQMNPSYVGTDVTLPDYASGRMPTRSLVNQDTTVKLQANFLRIDEDKSQDDSRGLYTFTSGESGFDGGVNWMQSYLVEATLMSSPDNSAERLRSVYFDPLQSYNIRVMATDAGDGTILKDTTDFYHTRMVGWYPMNSRVPRNDKGVAATVKFNENYYDAVRVSDQKDIDGDGVEEEVLAIQFTGLDGKTDVMVSDMREGQHWHFNDGVHRSDFMPDDVAMTGESIYASPFGHFEQQGIAGVQREIKYRNFFTFYHYLSAVRIFAYADQSPQNLLMWGDLESVLVADQPTSVKVWLPTEVGVQGEAYDWDDYTNLPTIGTPIFGEDDSSGDMPQTVEFPVSIVDTSSFDEQYLGYALVQPDRDLTIQITTSSGIYSVTIPKDYTPEGESTPEAIFQAGYIYDIHLNLETSGTIAALLQREDDDVFWDLTKLEVYTSPEDEGEDQLETFQYANCYVCSPEDDTYVDEDGVTQYYDGYCFSATTIGNGQAGVLSQGAQTLYPTSAHIEPTKARLLWESELGLVSQVELLYGYVRFKTPEDKSRTGNAVIAVYDDDDNVLWSWHIWITNDLTEQTFNYTDASGEAREIVMLDRNLGAAAAEWDDSDPESALDTYGLYYQWGRKDPSMAPMSYNYYPINLITDSYFDYSSRERNAAEVVLLPQPTLQDGVENPMFLILPTSKSGGYNYDWLYDRNDFLWGYNTQTGSMQKTIYDPCPWGYRVPLGEIQTIFSSDLDGVTVPAVTDGVSLGQTLIDSDGETFWFPYAGYKGVDKGLNSLVLSWKYVGEKGDYMSSNIRTNAGAYQYHRERVYLSRKKNWTEIKGLSYTNSNILTGDFTNRRTAASVRCVKSDVMGSLSLKLIPSSMFYTQGETINISIGADAVESLVSYALLTVTQNGVADPQTRTLYEGKPQTSSSTWSHAVDWIVSNGGEFWGESYTLTLTAENDLGARKTTQVSIKYHDFPGETVTFDVSDWQSEDAATTLFAGVTHTRHFDIITSESGTPTNVKVTYVDGDKTVVVTPTLISSSGNTHTYEVEYAINNSGLVEFQISAMCPHSYLSFSSDAFSADYSSALKDVNVNKFDVTTSNQYFYWYDQDISFDWEVASPNGKIVEMKFVHDFMGSNGFTPGLQGVTTDSSEIFITVPDNDGTVSLTHTFTSEDYVSKDIDGRFQIRAIATDEYGQTHALDKAQHSCYIIYPPEFVGFDTSKSVDEDFTVSIIISGGAVPNENSTGSNGGVIITIDGGSTLLFFDRDTTYQGTTGRYGDTKWDYTFQAGSLSVGTHSVQLQLWFWTNIPIYKTAPSLTITN